MEYLNEQRAGGDEPPVCPKCAMQSPTGFAFCGHCGTSLRPSDATSTPQPPAAIPEEDSSVTVAERRQLTVLFCDLVGSTELSERLDPEDLHQLVVAYQATSAEVIERFEGYIAQYLGDGLLVYFGFPRAHEDDARRAVLSGLAIIQSVATLSDRIERERGFRLAVRLGIHTGNVVTGEVGGGSRREQLALGKAPNVAARLQGLAQPNQLVISAATADLVRGLFDFEALGSQALKGVAGPVEVFHVLQASDIHDRFEVNAQFGLSPLVGRQEELGLLLASFEKARQRKLQIVQIIGEAGIGKSRLLHGLRERLVEQSTYWICRCSPYTQNTAFYPLAELARKMLHISEEDASRDAVDKIAAAFEGIDFPLREAVPLFASFLSIPLDHRYQQLNLSPLLRKEKVLTALVHLLTPREGQLPVTLTMEDLHWVDPSTAEFIDLLLKHAAESRLLIVLTFRPDFHPPWQDHPNLTSLPLHQISTLDAAKIITDQAGGKVLPPEVTRHLIEKADGNPLFLEEITKLVLQSDFLTEKDDSYELNGPLSAISIPITLQGSLATRLDALGSAKEITQTAATIGRQFSVDLLASVSAINRQELQKHLIQLVAAQIIRPIKPPPRNSYVFRHALLQEAAHESLLRSSRQRYHRQVAEALITQFPEIGEKQPEVLARHFEEAGQAEKAIRYLLTAGGQAMGNSANLEAIAHLKKGLALLENMPASSDRDLWHLELLISIAAPLAATSGYAGQAVETTLRSAQQLCEQIHGVEPTALFKAVAGLGAFNLVRGELAQAKMHSEKMIHLAEASQEELYLLYAHYGEGISDFFRGELRTSHEHLTVCHKLDRTKRYHPQLTVTGEDIGVSALCFLALVEWFHGHPDRAARYAKQTRELAKRIRHPSSLAFALVHSSFVFWFCGNFDQTRKLLEEASALIAEKGFFNLLPLTEFLSGALAGAMTDDGDNRRAALQRMEQAYGQWQASGAAIWQTFFLAELSAVSIAQGEGDRAIRWLTEGIEAAKNTRESFWLAELYRLRGKAMTLLGTAQAAEESRRWLEMAVDLAHRQHTVALELRATISLTEAIAPEERSGDLLARLAEMTTQFEGCETTDLEAARALLA